MDAGKRPGLTTDEQAELKRLREENFELRRSNDISATSRPFHVQSRTLNGTRIDYRPGTLEGE